MTAARRLAGVLLGFASLLLSGCYAFGSYQSPRPVDPGHPKFVVAASRNDFYGEDEDFGDWTVVDAIMRAPISSHADLGLRGTFVAADGNEGLLCVAKIDLKVAPFPRYLAIDLPVGMVVPWPATAHVAPGLILGLPLGEHFELNASGHRYLYRELEEVMVSYSVGAAWFPRSRQGFGLRPEVAWMRSDNERFAMQIGIGFELAPNPPAAP